MAKRASELFQAIEAIVPFAGSLAAGIAGYDVALDATHDGKKALSGFGPGTAAFAVLVVVFMLVFRRLYRARGGSPWLVASVASAIPLVGLALYGLGLLMSA
jgi:hypothetical protein